MQKDVSVNPGSFTAVRESVVSTLIGVVVPAELRVMNGNNI